jgi:DNA-binding CsgD family transcriptional regulator
LDSLPRVALRLVSRLVPCEVSVYNEINLARGRVVAALEPEDDAPRILSMTPNWERFIHQHPLVTHFRKRPDDRPRKITDFLRQSDFEQLDIYRSFFGPLGLRFQMVTCMPAPPPLVVGISHNRARRDFSERDRRIMDVVRPHLRQAYENAALVSELRRRNRQLEHLVDHLERGEILIRRDGSLQHISTAALRYLSEFFPHEPIRSNWLPAKILDWAKAQIQCLAQLREDLPRPVPLLVDGAHGRLALRVIADSMPEHFIIVLSHVGKLESPDVLRGLGLTPREAEVLYWCIEGKSRVEIGMLLKLSDRTVQKHLEHIYAKLEVPNRVAAVTKALEWVRW